MDDEEAFQSHLDAHPDDFTCRLVFADWLDERDDPRAEGYRAMGRMGLRPHQSNPKWCWWVQHTYALTQSDLYDPWIILPDDWFDLLPKKWMQIPRKFWPDAVVYYAPDTAQRPHPRSAAEDAAALAFAKLPLDRRLELLSSSVSA